jgi:hypothetical protein
MRLRDFPFDSFIWFLACFFRYKYQCVDVAIRTRRFCAVVGINEGFTKNGPSHMKSSLFRVVTLDLYRPHAHHTRVLSRTAGPTGDEER